MTTHPTSPWAAGETTEKGARALTQFRETFGVDDLPPALETLARSEAGIADLHANLKRHLEPGQLSAHDKLLVAIAAASAVGSPVATRYLSAVGIKAGLSVQETLDAVAVASVCVISNTVYKFRDVVDAERFKGFRAVVSSNALAKSSLSPARVELIFLTVSSLNGCHLCVGWHLEKAAKAGVTDEQLDEAVRASGVALSLARVCDSLA